MHFKRIHTFISFYSEHGAKNLQYRLNKICIRNTLRFLESKFSSSINHIRYFSLTYFTSFILTIQYLKKRKISYF